MAKWKFASFIEVDKEYRVQGRNIWNFYWLCSNRNIEVAGPEGITYIFNEYSINDSGKTITFVAGEFSDGKIGIYEQDELTDGRIDGNTMY